MNVHLQSGRSAKAVARRLEQIVMVLAWMRPLVDVAEGGGVAADAVVLLGDFNAGPDEPACVRGVE